MIIGAGVLGVTAAYHIKSNNPAKSVLLVDRFSDVSQGNTARSNAMFRNTFTSRDNQLLANSTIDFYIDLQEKSKIDIGIRKTGYLWLMSEEQLSRNARHIEKMEKRGIETKVFGGGQVKDRIPSLCTDFAPTDEDASLMNLDPVDGGVFGAKCGRLDPSKLSKFYLERFLNLGGKTSFNTSAQELLLEPKIPLDIEGEPFVWQDASITGASLTGDLQGNFRAGRVLLACGAWTNEILWPAGIDGHVKAKKRQLFKIASNEKLAGLLRCPGFNNLGDLPFLILPKSGCFAKAIPESREFWVGCDDNLGREYIDIPARDLDEYKAEPQYYERNLHAILRKYLPQFENARPDRMWAGLYSYNTLDYLPFVFEEGGIIVIGGDSGSGIMKADSLGRIADALYREGDGAEATLFSGERYLVKKLGFASRDVEREEWVI